MNQPRDPEDELQALWKKGGTRQSQEDKTMLLELVREKGRSLREHLHGDDKANYMLLAFAPLFVLLAWRTRSVTLMHYGNIIVAVILVAGAAIMWFNERKSSLSLKKDNNLHEFQENLLQYIDRRIRLVRGIKYWYAVPLLLGISFIVYPIALHYLHPMWSVAAIIAGCLIFEAYVWRMYEVKRVSDLTRRREEIQNLLSDMDRAE